MSPPTDATSALAGDAAASGSAPGHAERSEARTLDTGAFPGFDRHVPANGYVWWYVDALSDDARHGLTAIAFIGSVFSPYYAYARRRGRGDPEHYCALNVALYGAAGKRWSLTERGRGELARDRSQLAIGPSALGFENDTLIIDVDEVTVPWPSRLRGRLRVHPTALTGHSEPLDDAGRHRWSPVAPVARVEVEMQQPRLRWSGNAYLDSNAGDEPLEAAFRHWQWSRGMLRDQALVTYDVERRDGSRRELALRFDHRGDVEHFDAPSSTTLAPTPVWRIRRSTRSSDADIAGVTATFEDTPFYARSLLRHEMLGQAVSSVHESLLLDRFEQRWVQMLLPFRMPRRTSGA